MYDSGRWNVAELICNDAYGNGDTDSSVLAFDSHADDFEDITLDDSDASSPDEFEEVELVEENDSYRTKRCPCSCHTDLPTTRRCKRVGHCLRCSLKVSFGSDREKWSKTFLDIIWQKNDQKCS